MTKGELETRVERLSELVGVICNRLRITICSRCLREVVIGAGGAGVDRGKVFCGECWQKQAAQVAHS